LLDSVILPPPPKVMYMFLNNFLAPIQVRLSTNFVSHTVGDEVIKFWKVKVKGQGRWGRYALY